MNTTTDSNNIPINKDIDIEHANRVACRFIILDLKYQCSNKIYNYYDDLINDKKVDSYFNFEWHELKKEFLDILNYYDEGHKLNEDFLLKIKGLNIKNKNIIFVKRLIKLIKITDEN